MVGSIEHIEQKFRKSQDSLVLQHSDLSLKSVSDMVEAGAIDVSPKYQRRERWTKEKESELIESFILNIPVPPIYLAEDEYGTYSVIDGKQRITAIHKFLRDELKLTGLEKFTEIEGMTFSDLPAPIYHALKIRPYLRVVTLLKQSDPDLKLEVFLRLNKAGVPLNSQEIRNVAFRGHLNDMIYKMSENEFLKKQLNALPGKKPYQEMVDAQFVLRFFTIKHSWRHFEGNMDKAMDSFMGEHFKISKEKAEILADVFMQSLYTCHAIWGDSAFLRPGGSKRVLQGFFDVQMVCISMLSGDQKTAAISKKVEVREVLEQLLNTDNEFSEAVSQFLSNPSHVSYRIETFYNRMLTLL